MIDHVLRQSCRRAQQDSACTITPEAAIDHLRRRTGYNGSIITDHHRLIFCVKLPCFAVGPPIIMGIIIGVVAIYIDLQSAGLYNIAHAVDGGGYFYRFKAGEILLVVGRFYSYMVLKRGIKNKAGRLVAATGRFC